MPESIVSQTEEEESYQKELNEFYFPFTVINSYLCFGTLAGNASCKLESDTAHADRLSNYHYEVNALCICLKDSNSPGLP